MNSILLISSWAQNLGIHIRDYGGVTRSQNCFRVFVSRLLPGSAAAATGLLAVGDEILEVNGIEVHGKTLGQVGGWVR